MIQTKAVRTAFASIAFAFCATASQAQSYTDPATGLAVIDPPPPFAASAHAMDEAERRLYAAIIDIDSTTGEPKSGNVDGRLCGAYFIKPPPGSIFTREELDRQFSDPDWLARQRTAFERMGTISPFTIFRQQGHAGIELTAVANIGPGAGTSVIYSALLDTQKGRTSLVCVTTKDEIEKVLPLFRALRASIRAPE
ncbi:hypothetical protein DWF00_07135 [Bosea caraganae]|uniref:DUF1795 domain-containing protein n=1 Tax=Bosea caraganae TaxID=2763117 RepID=A0A370L0U1_9HYPH|nr:hypothetical protein [Bosea caraganae]RDJ20992.1 hypothetical protein DWE98_21930 [Bosea caraganae]RDJ28491.1 hypothetical protein DWF00_07135 [Bosea caraganae]